MPSLAQWIIELAEEEPIEAVILGEMGWGDYGSEALPFAWADQPRGRVLAWEEALPWITYDFHDGYGAPGCNAIAAYTPSYVISVAQYDGSTSPFRIPRNPTPYMPEMPGG